MDTYFNGDGLTQFGTPFENEQFAGYTVSGQKYISSVCFGTTCKEMLVYSGEVVSQNEWLYD